MYSKATYQKITYQKVTYQKVTSTLNETVLDRACVK